MKLVCQILEQILTLYNSHEPVCLLVSKARPSSRDESTLFKNLNKPFFPIFVDTRYFELKIKPYGQKINITRKQFGLSLCFAVTCNNQQGATIDNGLVDLSIPLDGKINPTMASVALGRFRRRTDVTIIDDFDIKVLRLKPHQDLLEEEKRYKLLANETFKKYYSEKIEFRQNTNNISLHNYILTKQECFH